MALKNMNNRNMKDEMNAMNSNGRKVLEGGSLGDPAAAIFTTRTRRVIFADAKHYIHHEKSGEIIADLDKFLSGME